MASLEGAWAGPKGPGAPMGGMGGWKEHPLEEGWNAFSAEI
jgi:hypothetical protein